MQPVSISFGPVHANLTQSKTGFGPVALKIGQKTGHNQTLKL